MEGGEESRRPTKWVLAIVGLFLLAVLLGRVLIAGGTAWIALIVIIPLLLFVFSAAVSFRFAIVAAGGFVLVVLLIRWFLQQNPLGWIALALLPVLLLTVTLVGRVLRLVRQGPSATDNEIELSPKED